MNWRSETRLLRQSNGTWPKIAILQELPSNDCSISRGVNEIDHDQIGPKPTRGVNSKCGIVFFTDGILAGAFKSPAHCASDVWLVID